MLIMIDGIDGSGKSSIVNSWKKQLQSSGETIFDVKAYWQQTGGYPESGEFKNYDFIFTAEPTSVGVGRVIRDELIKNGAGYPARAIAEAYALDRLILYKKIVLPALQAGKCVIQDRGVSTSLCYQPLADKTLTTKFLSQLPGNALALQNRPDHLVLLLAKPEIALERLARRHEKQDSAIFEQLTFQKKAARQFASPEYQRLFTRLGSRVHELPSNAQIGIIAEAAQKLLQSLLHFNS
jgi:thymidylate kinase